MSNGVRRQREPGRLPVVNYTVGLAWPAPPQTHLYNFLEGSNSNVKRAPAWRWARTKERDREKVREWELRKRRMRRRWKQRWPSRRGFTWDSLSWLHSRYSRGICTIYYLLEFSDVRMRERDFHAAAVDFARQSIARCNNYFARSKPIMALRTSGEYKSCIIRDLIHLN